MSDDGEIRIDAGGEVLLAPGGERAVAEACCCPCPPCAECSGTQNPVVVTVTGACAIASGIYTYIDFWDAENVCGWSWQGPASNEGPYSWLLLLIYCKVSGTFCVALENGGYPFLSLTRWGGGCPCSGEVQWKGFPGLELACIGGHLVGEAHWTAAGTYTACDGCEVAVTWA